MVTAANRDDGAMASRLPAVTSPRLAAIRGDKEYRHRDLDRWPAAQSRPRVGVTSKSERRVGFNPLPKRRVVEQTSGRLPRWRRPVRDLERLTVRSAAMDELAFDPSQAPSGPAAPLAEEVPLQEPAKAVA